MVNKGEVRVCMSTEGPWEDIEKAMNKRGKKMRALEPALDRNEMPWDIRLQLFIASTYLFTVTIQETPGEPSFPTSTKHVARYKAGHKIRAKRCKAPR